MIKIRKWVSLGKILETEQWLNAMSMQGWLLNRIEDTNFYFSKAKPEKRYFFVMSSEKGKSNGAWLYHEFLRQGGIPVAHTGTYFLSPDLVLWISEKQYRENQDLFNYYFAYKNYRLIRRLVSNFVMSSAFLGLGILISVLDIFMLPSILYIIVASFLIGCVNLIMFVEVYKQLKLAGYEKPWNRPRRPGY